MSALETSSLWPRRWGLVINKRCLYSLGMTYYHGEGVRQDYAKAREWFEQAAAQGLAQAQYNLGLMYGHGRGVRQDMKKAKALFGQACDNGDQDGCDIYRKLSKAGH